MVNPFNLYIQFLLNSKKRILDIVSATVFFPLEHTWGLGKKQFPVMGQYMSRAQIPTCYGCFPVLLETTLETSGLFQPGNFIKSQFSGS